MSVYVLRGKGNLVRKLGTKRYNGKIKYQIML